MVTTAMVDVNKINDFWSWFNKNYPKLNPDFITDEMIDSLRSKILELGDFTWEIREGKSKPNMLIISPGGNVALLESTKKIINCASSISEWEFEYFKPPKEWDYIFTIDNEKSFNSSSWEYVLLKFSDKTFDILIKADNIKLLDEDEKSIAVDIVLESILGEKLYLEHINNFELVDAFTGKYKGKQNKITTLSSHINHSLNSN